MATGELLSSKITVIEEQPRVRGLPFLASAVLGITGLTERGALATPTTVSSFEEFSRTFGLHYTGAQVPLALWMFFLNGGGRAVVSRALGAGNALATVSLNDVALAGTVRVDASSVGAWGNDLTARVENASSAVAADFNLLILKDGIIVERFPNLSFTSTATRYYETIVNDADSGSLYVVLTDIGAATRPVNIASAPLIAGSDGAALVDADLIGAGVGFKTLVSDQQITLLAAPDITSDGVQEAMITFCEVTRNREVFAILDPTAGLNTAAAVVERQARTASELYAYYWPRIIIPNPSTAVYGDTPTITIPPSGAVAGVIARSDRTHKEGTFAQPAGVEEGRVFGVVDVETDEVILESNRDIVFPERVNPITFMRGFGVFIDGARTGLAGGNFPSVGERRGVSEIERTLKIGLQFARHKNNTRELRGIVDRTIRAYLMDRMNNGCFASTDPATAFFTDVGDGLNTTSVIRSGRLLVRIGVATNSPAEFIVIFMSQDTRGIEEELRAR